MLWLGLADITTNSFGQTSPTNDVFANAIKLPSQPLGSTVGSNVGATKEPGEPNHAGNPGGASVWWVWTAPTNCVFALTTSQSPFDTLLAVYTGSTVSNLTLVAADDDSAGARASTLSFIAHGGTVYYIAVDGFNGAAGRINLKFSQVAAARPVITRQPQAQAKSAGASATFSVAATSFNTLASGVFYPASIPPPSPDLSPASYGSLAYQWQTTNGPIAGATNSTLVLVNLRPQDAGPYSVIVSNAYGSAASAQANLTVSVGPAFVTLAGRAAASGYTDAPSHNARFNSPEGMAMDSGGNAYVADTWNHAIRRVAPDGTTTTFAGGRQGAADGFGTEAAFNYPGGVALDAAGNVYVADQLNHAIRMITAAGQVTTLAGEAGNKNAGFKDGAGATARFNHPLGIAVDSQTNVYVADTWNQVIRKITPDGQVTTVAGNGGTQGSADGSGTNALFSFPSALAVDSSNVLYVADSVNCMIRSITTNGVVTTLAGVAGLADGADGMGTNAHFAYPEGIVVDGAGNVFVADSGNHTIRKMTAGGLVQTLAGRAGLNGGTDAAGTNALFYQPWGLALDAAGDLFVVDGGNNAIREIAPNGVSTTLAGPGGSAGSDNGQESLARFYYPTALAVDASSNVYVADLLNYVIREITPDGSVSILAGQIGQPGNFDGPATNALFASPNAVAVDNAGNVYVADADNQTIRLISNGTVSTFAGSPGRSGSANGIGTNALFNYPSGVAVDGVGNVYVADTSNQTIRLITTNGLVSTLAGHVGKPGSLNGNGTNAAFSSPVAIAVDGAGNVYVADKGNFIIRKITPQGDVTNLAGLAASGGGILGGPGIAGSIDGPRASATFSGMSGLAVDAAGNIYVADTYNQTIRSIPTSEGVITLGGVAGISGSTDGLGLGALFFNPSGIAVSPSGQIYIADAWNNTIRVTTPAVSTLPILRITGTPGQVILSWPASATGFVLQTSSTILAPGTWAPLALPPVIVGGAFVVTNAATAPAAFFRLSTP